jgi:phage-related protein
VATLTDLIAQGVAEVVARIKDFIQPGIDAVQNFIDGMSQKIEAALDKARELVNKVKEAIIAKVEEMKTAGAMIVQGFIDGMESLLQAVITKANQIIEAAIKTIFHRAKMQSPSKVMVEAGEYFVMGLVVGMDNYRRKVVNSAEAVADGAITGITSSIGRIASIVNDNMDTNPVIRPVMDLTSIIAGTDQINSMFSEKALSLAATGRLAMIGSSSNVANETTEMTKTAKDNVSVNFVQNNYSPSSLSRLEIYRQTRNQLLALKGAV